MQTLQRVLFGTVLGWFLSGQITATEPGTPLLQNFTPEHYGAARDNWIVVQDQNGLIFVGNGDGVLVYDGHRWTLVPLRQHSKVRGLAVGPNNEIYVGGINEFGRLIEEHGQYHYQSLSAGKTEENFGNIWHIHAHPWGVIFRARDRLFFYRDGALDPRPFESIHSKDFGSSVLLVDRDEQIWLLDRDKMLALPAPPNAGTRQNSEPVDFLQLMPLDEQRFLFVDAQLNFCLYKRLPETEDIALTGVFPIPLDTREFLMRHELYTTHVLPEGHLAFGTRYGGLVITDEKGHIQQYLNRVSGILRNTIQHISHDRQGNLWLAMNNGIGLVEYDSPIERYDNLGQLFEDPHDLLRHNGHLYMGAGNGLFRLGRQGFFQLVHQDQGGVRALMVVENKLLAVMNQLLLVEGDQVTPLPLPDALQGKKLMGLGYSPALPNHLFLGIRRGLAVCEMSQGQLRFVCDYQDIGDRVVSIQPDHEGNLWLNARSKGLFFLSLKDKLGTTPALPIHTAHGLPPDNHLEITIHGKETYALTQSGVFSRIPGEPIKFQPAPEFSAIEGEEVHQILPGQARLFNKGYLVSTGRGLAALLPDEQGQLIHSTSLFERLGSGKFYQDVDDTIWVMSTLGLFRVHPRKHREGEVIKPLILQVLAGEKPVDIHQLNNKHLFQVGEKLSIHFTTPMYNAGASNQYSYFLEGYDKHWQPWTKNPQAEYLGLPGGLYTFKVKSANVLGNISEETHLLLTLPKVWYLRSQTWLIAGLLFTLMMVLAFRWYGQRLQRIFQERQEQMAALQESQKMEALGRLAGAVAHDFNRVLTNIFGLSHRMQLQSPSSPTQYIQEVEEVCRSGQQLVRRILGFSKPGGGHRTICVNAIVEETLALTRLTLPNHVHLQVDMNHDPCWIWGNATQVQQIIFNLCENGIHALQGQNGELRVTLSSDPQKVWIQVTDSGVGMDEHVRRRIFEPFFTTRSGEGGTGLGLAVVSSCVSSMKGELQLTSSPGEGCTIKISFPRHPTPQQIPQKNSAIPKYLWVDHREERLETIIPQLRSQGFAVAGVLVDEQPLADLEADPNQWLKVILAVSEEALPPLVEQITRFINHQRIIVCLPKGHAVTLVEPIQILAVDSTSFIDDMARILDETREVA